MLHYPEECIRMLILHDDQYVGHLAYNMVALNREKVKQFIHMIACAIVDALITSLEV